MGLVTLTPEERETGEVRGAPAPAKINRFLHVVGRRPDGYHLLESVFQLIDLVDRIDVKVLPDERIERINPLPGVPPEQDLTVRAARLLQQRTGCRRGAAIGLDKVIPMGGGLGGGSSNAATVLEILNALWALHLSSQDLARIGLELGADIPFFLLGTHAFVRGIGEVLEPIALPEHWFVVVAPAVSVPTATVFRDPQLTRNSPALTISGFQDGPQGSLSLWRALSSQPLRNDLQGVVQRLFPPVAQAIEQLSEAARHAGLDPAQVRMSGSGACIFLPTLDSESAHRVASEPVLRDAGSVRVCRSLSWHPLGSRQVG
jgi:4-diphosphocytidyl-2-C-methyl-D-erythritol kinase